MPHSLVVGQIKNMHIASHEREWKGLSRPVDKGLKDVWLEKMNGMQYFRCYSSCEGHTIRAGAGWSTHPKIWLFIDEPTVVAKVRDLWSKDRSLIERLIEKYFPDSLTMVDFCVSVSGSGKYEVGLKLNCREKRISETMPASIEHWFNSITGALMNFEVEFASICNLHK